MLFKQVHRFTRLPPSLLRLLVSDRVFKIGSGIKGDLTHLRNQFKQLRSCESFTTIDLKDYAIQCGVIQRSTPGSLDVLVEKVLGVYLPKDDDIRKSDDWEEPSLCPGHLRYATNDVFASRLAFDKMSEIAPIGHVSNDTPSGTRVALSTREGGDIVAYGYICAVQPPSLLGIHVQVPTKSRLVIEVDTILQSSAALPLHRIPDTKTGRISRTKAGCRTLAEIKAISMSDSFKVVAHVKHLTFDSHNSHIMERVRVYLMLYIFLLTIRCNRISEFR